MATRNLGERVVHLIQPEARGTLFNVGELPEAGNPSLLIPNDHPAYSAIFALVMASAVNKKPLHDICVEDSTPLWTVLWVNMKFMP
jgi:hypothetical protein